MATLNSIFKDIKTLSDNDIQTLFDNMGELLSIKSIANSIYNDGREHRYSSGVACVHCGSISVIKYGKTRGAQRFKCKDCHKTFNDRTLTPMANSKVTLEQWLDYCKCMVLGLTIRKSAEICEVCVKTSFYMRHRILDAIRNYQGIGEVGGVVELDETFLPESFKGNHTKSSFKMPRKARKRGKQVKKRGISNEQICIATAIDRNSNMIFEMVTRGRISSEDIKRVFEGRLDPDSLICTDSHKSYIRFGKTSVAEHIRIESGKHKKGVYHISHVNSLHSRFKRWVVRFHGISTKYCPNYLNWFKWLENINDEKESLKAKHLMIDSFTKLSDTRLEQYKHREPQFT
jgi:transposase-like protein